MVRDRDIHVTPEPWCMFHQVSRGACPKGPIRNSAAGHGWRILSVIIVKCCHPGTQS